MPSIFLPTVAGCRRAAYGVACPVPALNEADFSGPAATWAIWSSVLLGVFIILPVRELSLFLVFWVYSLALPVHFLVTRHLRREQFSGPDALPR